MTNQPPQFQQQPGPVYGYPPQAPPKKRKVWPWVLGGVALAVLAGCIGMLTLFAGGAKVASDAVNEMDQNQKGQNAVAGQIGKPAKDGKFEFTVTKMKCGVQRVGSADFGVKAQGEFCLVDVVVKNVGQSAELFDSSSQKAYDAKGTEFSVDGGAETYVNDQNQTFLENINPGNKVTGTLAFDVPPGTKLASIVVHESMFTPGIKVPLQ